MPVKVDVASCPFRGSESTKDYDDYHYYLLLLLLLLLPLLPIPVLALLQIIAMEHNNDNENFVPRVYNNHLYFGLLGFLAMLWAIPMDAPD